MITVVYLITFMIIALLVVKRVIRDKYISLYPTFIISIAGLYLLVPAIVFVFGMHDKQASELVKIIYCATNWERISTYFLVLLSLIAISIPQKVKIGNSISRKNCYTVDDYDTLRVRSITYDVCCKWFWALWLVGMGCMLIMIANIGLKGFFTFSGSSRGEGDLQLQSGSLFAYATNFSKLLIASLVPGILVYEIKKSDGMKLILISTLLLSGLLQVFNAGKTNFIIFLVPLFIYWATQKGLIKVKYIIGAAIAIILLVPFLDNAFYYISRGESVGKYRSSWNILNYVMSVVRQFTYPYVNMVMREPITECFGYRYFLDYVAVVINMLPASLLGGFQLDTLYHITTEYYNSILSNKGGMPNDFIFFCYRQLGVWGVLSIGIITGALIKKLDKIFFEVKCVLSTLKINISHFLTSFCLASIVFILIEPLSVFMSFPMIIISIVITIHIKHCLRMSLK